MLINIRRVLEVKVNYNPRGGGRGKGFRALSANRNSFYL